MPEPEPQLADAALDLILLRPEFVRFFRTGGSAVRMELSDPQVGAPRTYLSVTIARAFPMSKPDEYIGLRDTKDKDIGMLQSLQGLEPASRTIVEEELTRRYFLPRVTKVRNVKEEFGTTTWDVETDKGDRTFIVLNLRDATHYLTSTRLLIVDRDGSRFEIPDIRALDERSFSLLQRVL